MILVTGGAGFIGSNFVFDWLAQSDEPVINLDALTYAADLESLADLTEDPRHFFIHGDIGDFDLVAKNLVDYKPRAAINFAAESHVDRETCAPTGAVSKVSSKKSFAPSVVSKRHSSTKLDTLNILNSGASLPINLSFFALQLRSSIDARRYTRYVC